MNFCLLPVVLICIQTFAVHLANEKLRIKSRTSQARPAPQVLPVPPKQGLLLTIATQRQQGKQGPQVTFCPYLTSKGSKGSQW
jgi:hypothetical protein